MRAREFITEQTGEDGSHGGKKGKLHHTQQSVLGKVHRVAGTADRVYDLNRAMMAAAASDGKDFSHTPDSESWIARYNMAYPYTELEHDMLHHAYGHLNMPIKSGVSEKSAEPEDTHKISPVVGFRGYK